MNNFVVTVTANGTAALFGPFPSRAKAWRFANQVRCDRRRDDAMPAVNVQPILPGRMNAFRT